MESVIVHFRGEQVSPWVISHYIEIFATYLTRVEVSLQIANLLNEGADQRRIYLIQESRDLWIQKVLEPRQQLWITLAQANRDLNEDFFTYLNRIKRQSPWYLRDKQLAPLSDIYLSDFLYLRRVKFSSPREVSFRLGLGIDEIIRELRFGKRIEKCRAEEQEEQMRQARLDNQIRERELLSKAMDNVTRMEQLKKLLGEYRIQIGDSLEVNIGGLERLNDRAEVSSMELPERTDDAQQ